MAFRSKVSPFVRSSLSVFRSPIVRRTLTSQSKESASYFRFAGPFVIGATAAGAGLFAASRLYNNNFTFFENVHAATKVICLDVVFICIYIGMEYFWGLNVTYDFMSRHFLAKLRYSWFATTWQGGHVRCQYLRIFSRRIFTWRWSSVYLTKERNVFVLDHQHGDHDVTCKLAILVSPLDSVMHCLQYYCSFTSLECKTIAPS